MNRTTSTQQTQVVLEQKDCNRQDNSEQLLRHNIIKKERKYRLPYKHHRNFITEYTEEPEQKVEEKYTLPASICNKNSKHNFNNGDHKPIR